MYLIPIFIYLIPLLKKATSIFIKGSFDKKNILKDY